MVIFSFIPYTNVSLKLSENLGDEPNKSQVFILSSMFATIFSNSSMEMLKIALKTLYEREKKLEIFY